MSSPLARVVLVTLASVLSACGGSPDPLWPGTPPGALGSDAKDVPTLERFAASGTNAGPAVVVCPGGGYRNLALGHEGETVARWLQSRGVHAFVLRYRLPANGYRHPVPLQDLQRALRTVRARAAEWQVDPARVGVMGFSAGGHLVTTACTHFDDGRPGDADPVERQSSRPDFCLAIYPVVTLVESDTHAGSRDNLLGPGADPALLTRLSAERNVTPRTPPSLLVHSADDATVPPENSLRYYRALRAAGVPAELHLFDSGGHGFGVGGKPDRGPRDWLVPLESWMRRHGWMP
jgi:acetyl esterase/lipase